MITDAEEPVVADNIGSCAADSIGSLCSCVITDSIITWPEGADVLLIPKPPDGPDPLEALPLDL